MSDMTSTRVADLIGRNAVDRDGDKIGAIADVYLDDASGEPACKRDSVAAPAAGGHPSLRPTRKCPEGRTGSPSFLLGLAPGGVYPAAGVAPDAGALLPHPFTLTCDRKRSIGGLLSVALFRQVTPTWLSPAPCPVESRLSSARSMPCRGHPADSPSHARV